MSTPTENPSISDSPIFDPFPEPNTMPSGWDLSGLIPDLTPAATVEDSADTVTP